MFDLLKEQEIVEYINDLRELNKKKKQAKENMDACQKIIELNTNLIPKYNYVINNLEEELKNSTEEDLKNNTNSTLEQFYEKHMQKKNTIEDYTSRLDKSKADKERYEQELNRDSEDFSKIEQDILEKYWNYTIQIDWEYVATLSSEQQCNYFDHLAEMIAELPEIDPTEIKLGGDTYTINKKYIDVVKTCYESIKKVLNKEAQRTYKNTRDSESYLDKLLDQVKESTVSQKEEETTSHTESTEKEDTNLATELPVQSKKRDSLKNKLKEMLNHRKNENNVQEVIESSKDSKEEADIFLASDESALVKTVPQNSESYLQNLLNQMQEPTVSEKKVTEIPNTKNEKEQNTMESYLDDLLNQVKKDNTDKQQKTPEEDNTVQKTVQDSSVNTNNSVEDLNDIYSDSMYEETLFDKLMDIVVTNTASFDKFMDGVDEKRDNLEEKIDKSKETLKKGFCQLIDSLTEKLKSRKKVEKVIDPSKDSKEETDIFLDLNVFTSVKKVETKADVVSKAVDAVKERLYKIKNIRKMCAINKKRIVQATAIAAIGGLISVGAYNSTQVQAKNTLLSKAPRLVNEETDAPIEEAIMSEDAILERFHIAEEVKAMMEEEATIEKREGVEVSSPQTSYNYRAVNYNADLESLLAMDTREMVHAMYEDHSLIPSMGVYYDIPLEKYIQDFAHVMELKTGVPASAIMTFAITGRESRYTLGLESSTGDIGGTQINWYWHAGRAARLGWTRDQVKNEWIPAIDMCIDILKDGINIYGYTNDNYNMKNLFAGYNGGFESGPSKPICIEYAQDCMNRVENIYSTLYTNEIVVESPEEELTR